VIPGIFCVLVIWRTAACYGFTAECGGGRSLIVEQLTIVHWKRFKTISSFIARLFPSITFWTALAVAMFCVVGIGILALFTDARNAIVNIVPDDDGRYYDGMPSYIYSLTLYLNIVRGLFCVASVVLALVVVIKIASKRDV
jgi:uncharacterized membrane protein